MVKFQVPNVFENRPNLVDEVGDIIRGKKKKSVLLITSETSLAATEGRLLDGLEKANIQYEIVWFTGYPTVSKYKEIVSDNADGNFDVVLAVGGGRVCDISKIVASELQLSIFTFPTIAATCASWANVSILYDDTGAFTGAYYSEKGPELILADTKIILNAPEKYLNAGIVDTFAKWYEISTYLEQQESTDLLIMTKIAQTALEIMIQRGNQAIEEAKKGIFGQNAVMTIDSIIFLAGLTGSIRSGKLYHGIAHTFYNCSTQVGVSSELLHGEKIAFGLILQQVLRETKNFGLVETIELFDGFDSLFTFVELGLEGEPEKVRKVAEKMFDVIETEFSFLGYVDTLEQLEQALYKTDNFIREYKSIGAIQKVG